MDLATGYAISVGAVLTFAIAMTLWVIRLRQSPH